MKVIQTERGSSLLAALASIFAGITFTLLFANLVRYVAASNAVEQAAEKTARCITPTDPDCVTYAAVPVDSQADWFAATAGKLQQVTADRYNYIASLISETWQASYPQYLVHKVKAPEIAYDVFQVPTVTYQPQLNDWEYKMVDVKATYIFDVDEEVPIYRPRFEPNFPDFDRPFEDRVKDRPFSEWYPGSRKRKGSSNSFEAIALDGKMTGPIEQHIASGQTGAFETKWFEVPTFPESKICRDDKNKNCDIDGLTGDNTTTNANGDPNWKTHAHIALKAFGEFKKSDGQSPSVEPQVKWSGSPHKNNDQSSAEGWGLQLDFLSPSELTKWKAAKALAAANHQPEPEAQPTSIRCLGGRTWGELQKDGTVKNYHLVLRGSDQADGGDEHYAVCPNGVWQHYPLSIERGGAYRIRAWIKAKNGDVDAKLRFWHYTDAYDLDKLTETKQHQATCHQTFTVRYWTPAAPCPGASDNCSEPLQGNPVRVGQCEITKTTRIPVCGAQAPNMANPTPVPEATCGKAIKVAACNAWAPSADSATCPEGIPSDRIICGWKAVDTGFSPELPGSGQECKSATTKTLSLPCGDNRTDVTYRPDGNYGEPNSCPQAWKTVTSLLENLRAVNEILPAGAPKLVQDMPLAAHWAPAAEYVPEKWVVQDNKFDEYHQTLDDPSQIREETVNIANTVPIYKRKDPKWQPDISAFSLTPDFLNGRNVSFTHVSDKRIEFTEGYPFDHRPEFQIPDYLPTDEAMKSCSGEPASLETRLRFYASKSIPAATDESLIFEAKEEKVDEAFTNFVDSCNPARNRSISVPQCTKTNIADTKEHLCYPGQFLGRFAGSAPAACSDGTYAHCYSQSVVEDVPESAPTSNLNVATARARGYEEISRALPGSGRDCQTSGCASIQITGENEALTSVAVRYEMPLTFPFSAILGKDSLTIERSNQDVREMAAVGRFAGKQTSSSE